ncbi:MAG: NYN domain-containing protein [Planctomycetes bacterium]|nr:NYN domain-containing protein [Planctomycetota bacterium]
MGSTDFGAGLFDNDNQGENEPAPAAPPTRSRTSPAPTGDAPAPAGGFEPERETTSSQSLPYDSDSPSMGGSEEPDFGGEVVPIDDAVEAKSAALRRSREESHEARGVEPIDDRVQGAEIPVHDDSRGRRGRRGRGDRPERGGRGGRGGRDRGDGRGRGSEGRERGGRGERGDRGDRGGDRSEVADRGPRGGEGGSFALDVFDPRRTGDAPPSRFDFGQEAPPSRQEAPPGRMGRTPARPLPGPSYERGGIPEMVEPSEASPAPAYAPPPSRGGYESERSRDTDRPRGRGGMGGDSEVSSLRREIEELKAQLRSNAGGSETPSAYGERPAPAPVAPPMSSATPGVSFASQRVAVLADVPSLQRTAKKTYGRVVSYSKLLHASIRGRQAIRAIAFVAERDASDPAFMQHLRTTGYEIRRVDLGERGERPSRIEAAGSLALDAARLASRVDVLVIAGSDPELLAVVPAARAQGCRVELAAFPEATPEALRESVDAFLPIGRDELIG